MKSKVSLFALLLFTSLALLHSLDTTLLLSPALLHLLLRHHHLLLSLLWCISISVAAYIHTRPRPILLLDYSCFRPGSDRRCSLEVCEYFGLRSRRFSDTSADFMRAIYRKSGLGDETYGPPFIFQNDYEAKLQYAVQEAKESMFPAADALLKKTAVDQSQITHLIVGCSMFSPAPSLSSLIVSHFGLHDSVKSYNLSGMGCSAGTLAFDLASHLLSGREIGYALIVVTESTSLNWYV